MKVSELEGAALDWAVAKCEGVEIDEDFDAWVVDTDEPCFKNPYKPSTNWSQGGPLMEWHGISVGFDFEGDDVEVWFAYADQKPQVNYGPTVLIAAMRCHVASNLGDEIDVPKELQ